MTAVLLVEDDPDFQSECASSLRAAGFDVITAGDGGEIEAIVSIQSVQIIVSDTDLPHLDGDQACKTLLEKRLLVGVFITGMSDDRDCEVHWKDIADDFRYKGGIRDLGTEVRIRYEEFKSKDGKLSGQP